MVDGTITMKRPVARVEYVFRLKLTMLEHQAALPTSITDISAEFKRN
jgi:hypothetical protein